MIAALILAGCAPPGPPLDDVLRLNHLQAKGTHNSYHIQPTELVVDEWRYTHAPLDEQLELQGVRHFELDVQRDAPDGPLLTRHLATIDPKSNCPELSACFAAIASWSAAHPRHHGIVVIMELRFSFEPASAEALFGELEAEAARAFGDTLFTPAMLAGTSTSVRAVVLREGWPTLGAMRGKVIVALNESGEFRTAYTHGDRDYLGRSMFVTAEPDQPTAALIKRDDPSAPDIPALVRAGYLVRTRSDSDTVEARANDRGPLERALASGAQIVSTDFPAKVPEYEYWVDIPGGTPSRCSPVGAPTECSSLAIEDPEWLAD